MSSAWRNRFGRRRRVGDSHDSGPAGYPSWSNGVGPGGRDALTGARRMKCLQVLFSSFPSRRSLHVAFLLLTTSASVGECVGERASQRPT